MRCSYGLCEQFLKCLASLGQGATHQHDHIVLRSPEATTAAPKGAFHPPSGILFPARKAIKVSAAYTGAYFRHSEVSHLVNAQGKVGLGE